MKHLVKAFCFAAALAVGALAHAQTAAPATADPVYTALGGKPGIDLLVNDFVPRVFADPQIGSFFAHTVQDDLKKQLADQFCVVSGGPCAYDGATMKKAHADLGIRKADFNRLVEILQVSMDARDIPFADQNRFLARLAPMHRDVVEPK